MVKTKKNLTEGPLFLQLLLFSLPIMLTGLLQVCYNMADNIVVGQFSGNDTAIAAVASTTSLTTLAVNLLVGLASGSGVIVAHAIGARQDERVSKSVHTAMAFSVIGGIAFSATFFALSSPLLTLLGTKEELFADALLYFRIICLGIPASTVYNFGAAIIRSTGNSRTPLFILGLSGLGNVLLNLFFVIVCGMSVDGVSLATIIAQYASAISVVVVLMRSKQSWKLTPKKLKINKSILLKILRQGVPTGLQSALFSLTNIIITSAVNQFPTPAITGKGIAFNIDGMVYTAMDSYTHSTMTFVGQNYGARKFNRVMKSSVYALIQVATIGFLIGQVLIFFSEGVIGWFINPDVENKAEVVYYAKAVMKYILSIYFLCGVMHTLCGALRGLGNSLAPMLISVIGTVVVRVIWVYIFFPMEQFHSLIGLYYCYPITWVLSIAALVITFIISARHARAKIKKLNEQEALTGVAGSTI